ncbi:MAG: peptidylprolyl isomerase [Myxococcota bacterium]
MSVPRRRLPATAGLVLTLWAPLACLAPLPARAGDAELHNDGIAAVVGDEVILLSEVDAKANRVLRQVAKPNGGISPELREEVRRQAVEALISERLILQFARSQGLQANEAQVDASIGAIADREGITIEELYAALDQQGIERSTYRKQLADQMTRMEIVRQIAFAKVKVTDAELHALFDERYGGSAPGLHAVVRHILIPWPGPDSGEPHERSHEVARKIVDALAKGESFGALAQQFSAAPSAADGGQMTIRQGDASPEIEKWAFSLAEGETSPPFETQHGVNLLQVVRRFDPSEIHFKDVEDDLRAELMEAKANPVIEKWVAELREQRWVDIVAPDLRPQ